MRVEQVMFRTGAVRRAVVPTGAAGAAPRETGAASGLLNSSRQIGASLGLAALGTVARNRTGQTAGPVALNDGYALSLTLNAALLVAAVLTALTVLRRTSPPSRAEQADNRDLLPGIDRQSRDTITVLHPVPEVRLT